jgi:hypothetical protein
MPVCNVLRNWKFSSYYMQNICTFREETALNVFTSQCMKSWLDRLKFASCMVNTILNLESCLSCGKTLNSLSKLLDFIKTTIQSDLLCVFLSFSFVNL